MKLEILEPIGYCFGVSNAIQTAVKTKKENPDKNVIILGDLVHNNDVINYLSSVGIISTTNNDDTINSLGPDDIAIFTAHGHDEKIDKILIKNHVKIVDCVCPKVKSNMELIRSKINNGYDVIFVGIKNHPETNACLSISEKVHLFDVNDGIADEKLNTENKIFITNQSTLNFKDLNDIFSKLSTIYKNSEINNEICSATRIRQENILKISDDVDCVFVVGDSSSSNSKRLFDISKQYNKKASTYMVSCESEISKEMILNKNHIVITSGTSVPVNVINLIVKKLKELSK